VHRGNVCAPFWEPIVMRCRFTHPTDPPQGKKEKHFFDKDDYLTASGLKAYLKEFGKCGTKFTIDSTPRYIQEDFVPGRIVSSYSAANLAKKKFILVLREPIARQYSEYQMRVRVCLDHGHVQGYRDDDYTGDDNTDDEHQEWRGQRDCNRVALNYKPNIAYDKLKFITFETWVHSENGQQEVTRGHYREHIQRWIDAGIGRHQLFILSFQTLIKNTTDVSQRLARFLGLESDWGQKVELPVPKQRKPDTYLDCKTYDELDKYYKRVNKNLFDYINNAADKPEDEPTFPWFDSSRATCTP
jgi:Sulfotransferase domain